MPTYCVTYDVRSGIDGFTDVISTGQVEVAAPDENAAGEAGVRWAYDNDPAVDDRIDPQVRISDVTELDDVDDPTG